MNKIISRYKNLSIPVKAALWYTFCNVLNKSISLLATPIFTRIMTEEQYGTFAVFQSWYNIIIIFTSLNIFLGGYQKGILKFQDDIDAFTSSQLSLTTLITLAWVCLYILFKDQWTSFFELPPVLMFFMFIELLVMPALEFWSARERFYYHYKKYVIVSLSMAIGCIFFGVGAVLMANDKVLARVSTDVIVKAIFAGTLYIYIVLKGGSSGIPVGEKWHFPQ